MNLFEYLYKYVRKAPGNSQYDVTFDDKSIDEIQDWLRGRYVCVTEAAWRILGYHTYVWSPHVIVLPVHLENEDSVYYDGGQEEEALDAQGSQLSRFFWHPGSPEFVELTYKDYFGKYIVTAIDPQKLRHHLPVRFPDAQHAGAIADDCHLAFLDQAPAGQQHFVYKRPAGKAPVCRLEMEYPNQQEVYFSQTYSAEQAEEKLHGLSVTQRKVSRHVRGSIDEDRILRF